ncbi:MAG: glycosyltransferase family 4 protein [Aquificae bacterium]|nr:glycosyltransferase family 4 protein [Aquificota bacterium]
MKVLEVIDKKGWCGTKEQTFLITKELAKHIDVHLALPFEHRELIDRLDGVVPLKFYEMDNGGLRRYNLKNYKRLLNIIIEGNYDIVVANSSTTFNYLRLIYPFLKKKPKLVAVRRSGFIPSSISKNFKYKIADKIVVVSSDVYENLKEADFFPEKLVPIESGVDLGRFAPEPFRKKELREKLGFPKDKKIFVNVANWQLWRKGQDILLEAFAQLDCEDCVLYLVGNNTDKEEAKRLIKDFGLEGRVFGLGFREDVPDILNASDFFVLSSHSEGIAGALLQAMATGKVVLSTLAGGIGEYLKDGVNGFAVSVGDVKGLSAKMEKMLSLSEEEYDKISKEAVKTASRYSIENTAQKYLELFRELAKES